MAYAEKHGRGYRARWRDPAGRLRSASGFASRKIAVAYGRDREAGLQVHQFTRPQLIGALRSRSGPESRILESDAALGAMADRIIEALEFLDGDDGAAADC
jgi:hypothetical protein